MSKEGSATRADFHIALHAFLVQQQQRLAEAVSTSSLVEAINAKLDLQMLSLILATRFALYKQSGRVSHLIGKDEQVWKQLVRVEEEMIGHEIGRDGVHFAILEVFPSMPVRDGSIHMPPKEEIGRAQAKKSLQYHPDKQQSHADRDRRLRARLKPGEAADMMNKVNDAKSWLEIEANLGGFKNRIHGLFLDRLQPLDKELQSRMEQLLQEQHFEKIRKMLQEIRAVDPRLASSMNISTNQLQESIQEYLKLEVKKTKASIEQKWRSCLLRELHEDLAKMKLMSEDLEVEMDSVKVVEDEVTKKIEEEGRAALLCINKCQSWQDGMACVEQFGGHLLLLGTICTHLRDFKAQAEKQVVYALTKCYDKKWGVNFLFELGMRLGQGKIGDPNTDDATVAKVILNNFPQFSDVRTVIFNRETSATQKDVSETLKAALDDVACVFVCAGHACVVCVCCFHASDRT